MATTELSQPVDRFERGIREPLSRLRRAIRTYIVVEGAARVVIWTCLWCWGTFLLDWGLFRVFNLDYIRDGSQGVRNLWRGIFIPLLVFGLGVILYRVIARLMTALREPALALVLERRFPGVLEDRLVTAVELSEEEMADRYGYSWPMVKETQHGAATRLVNLDVRQVLNRKRQFKECLAAALLAIALLALAIFAIDAAAIWFQRDVMLDHRYWPKHTILQFVHYPHAVPHGGEAKIEMRAWKWVVATDTNAEGWRSLEWEDISLDFVWGQKGPKWDFHPFLDSDVAFSHTYWDILPTEWKQLSLDQVETRLQPEVVGKYRRELGMEVIKRFNKGGGDYSNAAEWKQQVRALFPAEWQTLPSLGSKAGNDPSVATLEHYLQFAAERVTPAELRRYLDSLEGNAPTETDAVLSVATALFTLPLPIRSLSWHQKLAMMLKTDTPEMNLSERDRDFLPPDWKKLSAKDLSERLQKFAKDEGPEAIGERLRRELLGLFAELDQRSKQKHIGHRRTFRQLRVPDDVIVEFEQVLGEEERLRTKPKVGAPKVRHSAENYDYTYEFKKVERPLRFRVLAGDTNTAWAQIDVKPIPTLKQLARYHEELGYLHSSNERVRTGPFPISLEGSESRFDVPAGTRLRLEGECYKDLRAVRPGADSSVRSDSVSIQLDPEGRTFHVEIGEMPAGEQRLRLDMEDTDGIPGKRDLVINVIADRPPEFQGVRFDVVNHKMITAQAVIPFSGQIRDDHGLVEALFDVTVEKDQRLVVKKRLPMLHFHPIVAEPAVSAARFEKYEDATFGRLMAGAGAGQTLCSFGIGRSPACGLLAWLPPIFGDFPKTYSFQYRERAGTGPVLGAEDEYLDTNFLRPPATSGSKPPPWPTPPYRLRVAVMAKDNRIVSDDSGRPTPSGQESANPETFEFSVVDESELLIEAGKREEDLRDRCEEIIANLKKARTALQRLRDDFPSYQEENEFRRAAADGQDMAKAIRTARDGVDQRVLHEFRQIYRELTLNRCNAIYLDRIDQKICRPLEVILQPGQHFERADEALDALIKAIEMEKAKAPRGLFSASVERTNQLISRLDEILIEMKKLIEFNQALTVLREIINKEKDIIEGIEKKYKEQKQKELQGK